MAYKPDVLELLTGDHREVERIFAAFEATRDPGRRRELVDLLVTELTRHSAVEEEHLHPVVRRVLPDGDRIAARARAAHAEAALTMRALTARALDGADPADASFARDVGTLLRQAQEHAAQQEHEVFPLLRAALTAGERVALGAEADRAGRTAPVRTPFAGTRTGYPGPSA
ncbi:hemerythrin domain-containing protein [Streptomyces sp. NPDC048172]|uniref:hemerythrin domain-containing protein n=1 Tax=Streptomyces sp. NPDC048172 TaxID=3365505 RepID=UPI0037202D01